MGSFIQPGSVAVILDGQFGSTGKGLIAGYLASQMGNECHIATTNASANAGHTTIIGERKFVTFHLPTFAVVQPHCRAYLNAGAIINPSLLFKEMKDCGFNPDQLVIHPRAAVITQAMIDAEASNDSQATKLASTRKGVGTALAEKIMRRAKLAGDTEELAPYIGQIDLNKACAFGDRVVAEIPQGFSLGINSGLAYPYCTSRDVTVAQGLADAGVHPVRLGDVLMTLRTYPIRVGNIRDENGVEIGNSGPCYDDQEEISFESIGQTPELTTVTKRVRRIFTFSKKQYDDAYRMNEPTKVLVNFVNYLGSVEMLDDLIDKKMSGRVPDYFGFGPSIADITESYDEAVAWFENRRFGARRAGRRG